MTLTEMEVLNRSIICSWVSVATATLQISTSRLPWRKPAFHAYPNGSTSATIPSKFTWKPSWPRPFRRRVISVVSQPRVTIWSTQRNQPQKPMGLSLVQTISITWLSKRFVFEDTSGGKKSSMDIHQNYPVCAPRKKRKVMWVWNNMTVGK